MNPTNATTCRQFNHLAPSSVRLGRKTYKRKGGLFDDSTDTVRFDYVGRKQRGAFIADKVSVAVTLDLGRDLYNVTAEAYDGLGLESREVFAVEGVTWEFFADLAEWVSRG